MTIDHKTVKAHHVAWFLAYGYWPKYLCHACDTPFCVRVGHLFEGDDELNHYDRSLKLKGGLLIAVPAVDIAEKARIEAEKASKK